MDRTGIIVVSLCVVLLIVWYVMEQRYAEQWAASHPATNAVVTAQTSTTTSGSNAAPAAPAAPTTAAPAPAAASVFPLNTNIPEQTIVLTNAQARYAFTSRGGGLKSVGLLNYPETVSPRWKAAMGTNAVATLNTRASVPVMAILGGSNLIGNGLFTLTRTENGVRAEKSLPNGLRIVKEFQIGTNYLVNVTVRLENTSDESLSLPTQEWVVGTATPMDPEDTTFSYYGGTMWFNGKKNESIRPSYFSTNTTFLFFFPRTPKTEYREGASNVVWAAVYNQFFTLIAMPQSPAVQVDARPVYLPPFPGGKSESRAPPEGIQTALIYPAQTLGTNQVMERKMVLYAGPKKYRMLAHLGEQFRNHADEVMQFGFFGFFSKALLVTMNWLHAVTRLGYGWVIVLFTVLIKVVFWPLTAKSTRSMKRMQALAPELKALQAKYKEEPQKLMQKQWELYRKHKVSPMSGCLPMLIQTPVFIGFYMMIRSAIELRGAHWLWVTDLSKPDTLFIIPGLTFIPFFSTPAGLPFNLLPLLMGAAMLWQSHLQPPSPGMDPGQAKIMRYMPLIFLVFLYRYSSGLTLYWTVNNLLTIAQTKLTKNLRDPAAPALTPAPKKKK